VPELPEVEVVRRGLSSSVQGRTLRRVVVRNPALRWPVPADLPARLEGAAAGSIERRGKYLVVGFPAGWLLVHLGMSGSLRFCPEPPEAGPHDHVDLVFEHGVLRYHDPRRFGSMLFHDRAAGPPSAHPLLAGLGVEPFSDAFDGGLLHRASRGRRVAVKQFLMSGQTVVGVGNIYASESLFRAGIRPAIAASRISRPRYDALAAAVRETLGQAIERGGSTLRDFVASDGASGHFQLDCLVYGRGGQPCRVCGEPVRTMRQQQRATYWCARCQR
jgi:formamidopyrimidine-DNA glycosylase